MQKLVHGNARTQSGHHSREHVIRHQAYLPACLRSEPSLLRRLADAAEVHADRPAVSAGKATMTYADLAVRVADIARALRAKGVRPGDRVGLCLARGTDLVASTFAAWACGAAYVPIDPKLPAARIESVCEQSSMRIAIIDDTAPAAAWPDTLAVAGIDAAPGNAGASTLRAMADEVRSALGHEEADRLLAYIIFTSGSTGKPKGVAIEHGSLRYFIDTFDGLLGSPGTDAVWIAGAALSFDVSIPEIFGALTTGSHVVVRNRLEPIAPLVERHGGTHLQCTPSQLAIFATDEGERKALSRLGFLLTVGEILSVSLAADVRRLMQPSARFMNAYGPTEITVYCSHHDIVEPPTAPISIGHAFPGTRWAVLDADRKPVPAGTMGELAISSPGVARGYIGRPDLTEKSFVHLDIDGSGVPARTYLTGDLVTEQPDGSMQIHGRRDHQIKIRGNRVELGEIEAVLLNESGVLLAIVLAVDAGDNDIRLVAHVSPREGCDIDAPTLKAACATALPAYMVPAFVVTHADLPRTISGKVDRPALAALPPPWTAGGDATGSMEPAAQPTDELSVMCRLWSQLLGCPVTADDNFFDLGGHSLLGVEMLIEAERELGCRLPLGTLVEASTPRLLLAAMQPGREPSRCVVTLREGEGPAIVVIHGAGGYLLKLVGLAQRLMPGHPILGIAAHGLDGRGEPDKDFDAIVRRYLSDLEASGHRIGALVGYSGGGVIAAAMAAELAREGLRRPPVVLLDTAIPAGKALKRIDYWRNLLVNMALGGMPAVRSWLEHRRNRHAEVGRRARIVAEAAEHGFVDVEGHLDQLLVTASVPFSDNAYTLVRAAQTHPSERPDFDWQRFTSVPVRTVHVAGDHFSMLDQPNVDELAHLVNADLASHKELAPPRRAPRQRKSKEDVRQAA